MVGTVVDKYENPESTYASIVLDDSTDTVRIKTFREDVRLLEKIEKGDIVKVIGRVRETEREKFVLGEIIKSIENPNYELLRKLELEKGDQP